MTSLIYKLFYGQPLSKIIFLMIVLVLAWAKLEKWVTVKCDKKGLWKNCNRIFCLCMIVLILAVTVSSRNSGVADVQWQPFHFLKEAQQQPEIYRSMLMNVFLFFPLGLTLPYALPQKWKDNAVTAILLALVLSIGIECLQYHFCLGRAETDDVICNTLGTAIGTLSYILAKYKNRMKEYSNSN